MITRQTLQDDLRSMGVAPDGTVLTHFSMKAIGDVEGRAQGVLEALEEYFADGLLVLPALSWTLAREEPPRVFDPQTTPSVVGLLPELFRTRAGVVRSLHPTHSVSAKGKDAEAFCAGSELCDSPCARTSPWGRLLERNATILMVGCLLTSCTFLHGVEEWTIPGHHLGEPVEYQLRFPDGSLRPMRSRPHGCAPSRYFGRAEAALRASGALADGRFGDAKVLVIDARGAYDTVSALIRQNPAIFEP